MYNSYILIDGDCGLTFEQVIYSMYNVHYFLWCNTNVNKLEVDHPWFCLTLEVPLSTFSSD